jgi:acid stress chaperone HdeB
MDHAMIKVGIVLAIAISVLTNVGHAQEREDMSQMTCATYLAMPPDLAHDYSIWMTGWYNQKFGYTTVGLDDFARNATSVHQWCSDNRQASIMTALDRSLPQPGPPSSSDKIDMSLLTCRQYLTSEPERKGMIGYWMSGYFRASTSQPVFDFVEATGTGKAVAKYCREHGTETVMSVIQNGPGRSQHFVPVLPPPPASSKPK